jgi:regulator of protease activity HflC (stomatin/prohibitin superfamily)
MDPLATLSLILLAIVLVLVLMGVRSVAQGYEYTVERFGRYTRTLGPGLNLIVPFVDRIGAKLNMMEQVLDVPSQQAITRDNAVVTVDAIVFYQVLDAAKAAYEVRDLSSATLNLTMTNIRTVIGSMDLDELLSRRDEINARLLAVVDEATQPWGVKVTRIEIKDITPPQDLVDSMARQMKAERDKRAAILQAEGERQAAILKAEGEKQAAILEAEGRREAAFRDAEARERQAEAEAKAAAMLSTAISEGSPLAVNYFVAEKYLKALEAMATSPNQKTLVLPVEVAGVIGSLAGIAEIAREAYGGGRSGPAASPGPWTGPSAGGR